MHYSKPSVLSPLLGLALAALGGRGGLVDHSRAATMSLEGGETDKLAPSPPGPSGP